MSREESMPDTKLRGVRCDRCGRDISEWKNCNRSAVDCGRPKARKPDELCLYPRCNCPAFGGYCKAVDGPLPPKWEGFDCASPAAERPATRIISVTEPGYDVALFFNSDGGAEAVITRPNEKPTGVNIVPPGPGRRIVVERKNGTFNVLYKDAP